MPHLLPNYTNYSIRAAADRVVALPTNGILNVGRKGVGQPVEHTADEKFSYCVHDNFPSTALVTPAALPTTTNRLRPAHHDRPFNKSVFIVFSSSQTSSQRMYLAFLASGPLHFLFIRTHALLAASTDLYRCTNP